ncbi:MAG: TerC/Alx family metal homeostasis membrane protein [Alphaproteobacteria bacterium]|nr:TerC/Alx family metal homeostasis membrane protein [Alphaproteobacteria bacterium]
MEILIPWLILAGLLGIFLALDLGIFNRLSHTISLAEALKASLIWITLALLFNLFIWYWKDGEMALAFFTGYLLEKMLSLDNIFVFFMLFQFFEIAPRHQHRILFWGIIGAIVFRLTFILIGIKLVGEFDWILYVFGCFLMYSSYGLFKARHKPIEIETHTILRWVQAWLPYQRNYKGRRFFLRQKGKWVATPLFLVLLVIEVSDIIFAMDSIPAIFAITLDPFLVFSSNIFAILGLRSLYFLLAQTIPRFYYLQHALSLILGFVGIKLILINHFPFPLGFSLGVISSILVGAIILSLVREKR